VTSDFERRILECPTLPSLPGVALELLALCQGEAIDLARAAEVLARDPALAARVLKAANVAAFGWRDVTLLTRAVTLLGAKAVVSIALAFSLVRSRGRSDRGGFDREHFWRRSLYASVAARATAERTPLGPEEAMLGGLLQDIGVLAMAEALGADYGEVWQASAADHGRLVQVEEERWGATHVEVGALLLARWGLPRAFFEAVRHSHQLPDLPLPRTRGLVDCVYLSGHVAEVWMSDSPGEAARNALELARRDLCIDREGLSSILARTASLIPEVASFLDVRLATDQEVARVLARARAALVIWQARAG